MSSFFHHYKAALIVICSIGCYDFWVDEMMWHLVVVARKTTREDDVIKMFIAETPQQRRQAVQEAEYSNR
jgi:hypothetical protein